MVWVPLLNKSRDLRYHLIFVAKMMQKFVQTLKYEQLFSFILYEHCKSILYYYTTLIYCDAFIHTHTHIYIYTLQNYKCITFVFAPIFLELRPISIK